MMQHKPRTARSYRALLDDQSRAEAIAKLAALHASRPLSPPRRGPLAEREVSAGERDAAKAASRSPRVALREE